MRAKNFTGKSAVILLILLILLSGCLSYQSNPSHEWKSGPEYGNGNYSITPEERVVPAGNWSQDFTTHFTATELLTRPTDRSVTISLIPSENLEISIKYGTSPGAYSYQIPTLKAAAGLPVNRTITGLTPDTLYYYRTCITTSDSSGPACGPEHTFHTQRSSGSTFTFAVQADSHLDEKARVDLYNQTLANELAGAPDFLIDLGDTFMSEKLPEKTTDAIRDRYLLQRSYLSTIGHSIPLFLVLGNHDGESRYALAGKDNGLARLSLQFRKMYFPNPEPDRFYTGNEENDASLGLKQDYYAWEWSDALFVILDPFWYTTSKPGGKTDGWAWTLGEEQYRWMKQTLEASPARYKFVFAHHLVGGDSQGRGGIEFASLYEWGGMNPDGTWGFEEHRPGWGLPIHQLLVANNVTAFFHGHDHLFAKQELDRVVYQAVPQPATTGSPDPGVEYGYVNGVILPSPGYLKVTVAPDSARVDYITTAISGENGSARKNGTVACSYTLLPSPAAAKG